MQGRKEFTSAEFEQIARLVGQKQGASASKQKQFRRELRQLGFYVADFDSVARTFGPQDLERLVREHRIVITDQPDPYKEKWWKRALRAVGVRL